MSLRTLNRGLENPDPHPRATCLRQVSAWCSLNVFTWKVGKPSLSLRPEEIKDRSEQGRGHCYPGEDSRSAGKAGVQGHDPEVILLSAPAKYWPLSSEGEPKTPELTSWKGVKGEEGRPRRGQGRRGAGGQELQPV